MEVLTWFFMINIVVVSPVAPEKIIRIHIEKPFVTREECEETRKNTVVLGVRNFVTVPCEPRVQGS